MVTLNKQKTLNKLFSVLGKRFSHKVHAPNLAVIEHLLLATVQEGTTLERGISAYQQMVQAFDDLNELRVSHRDEIARLLATVSQADDKSRRILAALQFVFETTYSFDLESMRRKPLKQAQRQLSQIAGVTPFVVAATMQRALGGHALPLDAAMCRLLAGAGLISENDPPEAIRTALEHLVPKAKGALFCHLLSTWAIASQKEQSELLRLIAGPRAKLVPAVRLAAPLGTQPIPPKMKPKPRTARPSGNGVRIRAVGRVTTAGKKKR